VLPRCKSLVPDVPAVPTPVPRVSLSAFDSAKQGVGSIALEDDPERLADFAMTPWFSPILAFESDAEDASFFSLVTGPARYGKKGWFLPIYEGTDPDWSDEQVKNRVAELRSQGFEVRRSES